MSFYFVWNVFFFCFFWSGNVVTGFKLVIFGRQQHEFPRQYMRLKNLGNFIQREFDEPSALHSRRKKKKKKTLPQLVSFKIKTFSKVLIRLLFLAVLRQNNRIHWFFFLEKRIKNLIFEASKCSLSSRPEILVQNSTRFV